MATISLILTLTDGTRIESLMVEDGDLGFDNMGFEEAQAITLRTLNSSDLFMILPEKGSDRDTIINMTQIVRVDVKMGESAAVTVVRGSEDVRPADLGSAGFSTSPGWSEQ